MKRSKLIIRFLEANDKEGFALALKNILADWKLSCNPILKIEQAVNHQILGLLEFIDELNQYVKHGQFSDIGFFILANEFFNKSPFKDREQFVYEFFSDWKRNSNWKKKKRATKKIEAVVSFIRALNKLNQT